MASNIRQKTQQTLLSIGITCDDLGIPERHVVYERSIEDILKRAISLFIISSHADAMLQHPEDPSGNKKFSNKIISRYGALEFFSPKEKEFLEKENPSQNEVGFFCWQWECVNALAWLLSLNDDLGLPNKQCEPFKVSRAFSKNRTYETISKAAHLRNEEELNEFFDLVLFCSQMIPDNSKIERGCIDGWKLVADWVTSQTFSWP